MGVIQRREPASFLKQFPHRLGPRAVAVLCSETPGGAPCPGAWRAPSPHLPVSPSPRATGSCTGRPGAACSPDGPRGLRQRRRASAPGPTRAGRQDSGADETSCHSARCPRKGGQRGPGRRKWAVKLTCAAHCPQITPNEASNVGPHQPNLRWQFVPPLPKHTALWPSLPLRPPSSGRRPVLINLDGV